MCRSCYEKDLRVRNTEFADRQRLNADTWRNENSERKKALDLSYRQGNKDKISLNTKYRRWSKYGLTPDQGEKLLAKFKVCPICGDDFGARGPDLDHNHETGLARGFI